MRGGEAVFAQLEGSSALDTIISYLGESMNCKRWSVLYKDVPPVRHWCSWTTVHDSVIRRHTTQYIYLKKVDILDQYLLSW